MRPTPVPGATRSASPLHVAPGERPGGGGRSAEGTASGPTFPPAGGIAAGLAPARALRARRGRPGRGRPDAP